MRTDLDCGRCDWGRPPALAEENHEAWALWKEVFTQWRATAFGVIGLDYVAVAGEAKRMGIDLTQCTMKKIKALEAEVLGVQNQNDDANNSDI